MIIWKKLDYELKTSTGAAVRATGSPGRGAQQIFPRAIVFTVPYSAQFPNINTPRGVESSFGIMTFVGVVRLRALRLAVIARVPLAKRPCWSMESVAPKRDFLQQFS